ncbi:MAG: hypothetical protein M0D55_09025 [Elusimicrobiota bacterium]|nr:MAG: hypothetical protein M0D55_09025 [Elusimicrobiota bacterium]
MPVSKRGARPERLKGVETLVEAYSKRGPFEPAFVRRVMAQACALVGAVHASGHGHGGVSPDSLVFDKDAVLSLLPPGPPTSFDGCAAPEGVASPRGDVFSLGATAYFLLVGRTPFDDSKAKADGEFVSASNRRTTLPLSIDLFFKKALAPDPAARFSDAAEFRAAFDKALEPK